VSGYRPQRGDWGLDWSGARLDPWVVAGLGVRFACRYLCYYNAGTKWKIITLDEAMGLGAADVAVVLNFEWYGTRMVDPNVADKYQAGVADAREAVAQARALGYPIGATIVFSCDTGITEAQVPMVMAYMHGAESVVEAAGFEIDGYGGWLFMTRWAEDRAARGKSVNTEWQAYAWSNVGANRSIVITPTTDIFQHLGHPHFDTTFIGGPSATDENEVVSDSTALMWVPGQPFTPDPSTPGTRSDMADFICTSGDDILAVGPGGVMPVTGEILDLYINVVPNKGDLSGMPEMQRRVLYFIENGIWPRPSGVPEPSMPLMSSVVTRAVTPLIPTTVKVDPKPIVDAMMVELKAALANIKVTIDPAVLQAAVAKAVRDVFATAQVVETTTESIGFKFV